ncbi:MAG: hypothetical protein GY927_03320 [bacterium]|nr:hypothetical protein [bacterium]
MVRWFTGRGQGPCRVAMRKSGSFREKLTDYAHAFARSQKFAMKGESILRDMFKERYGETMNHMREGLLERENTLRDVGQEQALHHARSIEGMIKNGETMPFYQAYDRAAVDMAKQYNITERGAKEMMKTIYREVEGVELYETGKAAEKSHHAPTKEVSRQTARETGMQNQTANYQQSGNLTRKRG